MPGADAAAVANSKDAMRPVVPRNLQLTSNPSIQKKQRSCVCVLALFDLPYVRDADSEKIADFLLGPIIIHV